jgi:hypothetical protein
MLSGHLTLSPHLTVLPDAVSTTAMQYIELYSWVAKYIALYLAWLLHGECLEIF